MMAKIRKIRDLKKLQEDFPDIDIPNILASKPDKLKDTAIRREICDFARDHNLVIHPSGYDYYIQSYLMFNCCPCDSKRSHCPCPESIEEVPEQGYCKCRLFWRSLDDFKNKTLKERI